METRVYYTMCVCGPDISETESYSILTPKTTDISIYHFEAMLPQQRRIFFFGGEVYKYTIPLQTNHVTGM
jgi:hypothetical protein